MPIKILEHQRRFAEQGRIRLGHQVSTETGTRPAKLDKFRFTSTSEQIVRDLAKLYGGEPRAWDNHGKPEWEVFSEAKAIPVIVVKGGLSQWMEFWLGGSCVHRCDGETNQLTDQPCDLEEKVKVRVRGRDVFVNPHTEAKPTTRASMMLPELESIGVFRLESHGWNAAAEIPAVAELAQFVGDLVPASLELQERRSVKDGKTSRFVVPVLDLKIATHRLREIVEAKVNGTNVLESPAGSGRPALQAGSSAGASTPPAGDPYAPYFDQLEACATVAAAQDLWHEMVGLRLVGPNAVPSPRATEFFEAFKVVGQRIAAAPADPQPDDDGAYPIDVVDERPSEDGDAVAVWQQILAAGGQQGMELDQVTEDFKARMGGLLPDEATAAEMRTYLAKLEAGEAA